MSQLLQGAPGVRIQLIDASQVTLVVSPNITGGIVGFSTRGELNTIIPFNSTSDMDVILGNGYNNPSFNQGLYAARAVLTSGGFVEFVRPYGETIITDDTDPAYDYNQQLKTDTYLVNYNFAEGITQSFDNNFWSSTRYVQDAYANYGSRIINTISDTIVQNNNLDFTLNAESLPDGKSGFNKESLFSIMNTDPTAANRAATTFQISNIHFQSGSVNDIVVSFATIQGMSDFIPYVIDVTTTTAHGLSTGDTVIIAGTTHYNTVTPVTVNVTGDYTFNFNSNVLNSKILETAGTASYTVSTLNITTAVNNNLQQGDTIVIGGTQNFNTPSAMVTQVLTSKNFECTVVADLTALSAEYKGAVYLNIDTVASGVDYIDVKTAARGQATKYLDGLSLNGNIITDGAIFDFTTPTGDVVVFEFDSNGSVSINHTLVSIQHANVIGSSSTNQYITLDSVSNLQVNDIVVFTDATIAYYGLSQDVQYIIFNISGSNVYLYNSNFTPVTSILSNNTSSNMYNQTATIRNVQNAVKNAGYVNNPTRAYFNGLTGIQEDGSILVSDISKFSIGDYVMAFDSFSATGNYSILSENNMIPGTSSNSMYVVTSINASNLTIKLALIDIVTNIVTPVVFKNNTDNLNVDIWLNNITQTKGGTTWVSSQVNIGSGANPFSVELIVSGYYGLSVAIEKQQSGISLFTIPSGTTALNYITFDGGSTLPPTGGMLTLATTDSGILLSPDVGNDFLGLGMATDAYVDINFSGVKTKVYMLNAIGLQAARIYLYVTYFFGGNTYQFSGTVVPFAVNSTNLYIGDNADSVAVGWRYVANDSSSLAGAIGNDAFDLSQSQTNGVIQSDWITMSFNAYDPAVLNNAIWSYDPTKNNSTDTYTGAWQLFLDKDSSDSDMLISAGTAINNLFIKNREEINYDVMNVMLNVCESRKDMFAIFDGVNEPNINIALEKMVGIGSVGDMARWGGIYDGRSIFFDSSYTKLNVQAVQTIAVANIITSNRAGGLWWLPPAGYDYGRMPTQWATKQLFTRTYKYAEDPTSDVARLYNANINPIRVNTQGQFVYGQKTMLKRTTALNRMNVIMLVAGIHKRFENYLDTRVFQLNTSQLRANIQADLQAQLNLMQSANPAGITAGLVVCNDTNNPPIIIDTNQLIVDVVIQPTRTAEFITLRTTVQRTGADLNAVTSTIIGG